MDQKRAKLQGLILIASIVVAGGCSVAIVLGSGRALVEAHQGKDAETEIVDKSTTDLGL